MDQASDRLAARRRHHREFFERLKARRPEVAATFEELQRKATEEQVHRAAARGEVFESAIPEAAEESIPDMVLETIVRAERPVLFLENDWLNTTEVTLVGAEARELMDNLNRERARFSPLMPLIGRIDVTHFPGTDFVGTGWFVTPEVVVTNRHVASLIARWDGRKFAFSRGIAGNTIASSVCTAHEFDDLVPDQARTFAVTDVLYIEPQSSPIDIAFLKVRRRTDGTRPTFIPVSKTDVGADVPVFVVGYPARAPSSVIPDQQLMKDLYRGRFDVKRACPGLTMPPSNHTTRHDCTTLGGNSGSVVLDLRSGQAVGLHFAGLYQESNFAVRASVLADYVARKRWLNPPSIETAAGEGRASSGGQTSSGAKPQAATSAAAGAGGGAGDGGAAAAGTGTGTTATITIPLSITVTVGTPTASNSVRVNVQPDGGTPTVARELNPAAVESAVKDFWDQRPDGVIAVRVGFDDAGDAIGDKPFIAASVPANRLNEVQAAGPAKFQSLEVRYLPAEVGEQIESLPMLESVDSIEYDDGERTGPGFSFATVNEAMTVTAHVGPEFSWDVLQDFLRGARTSLVSAMYEFHAPHIADAIENRLDAGVSLDLVLDNATFHKVSDDSAEFDRVPRFAKWEDDFGNKFRRIVAPEGTSGLISDAYHIKVTVREDDSFWLSSGNWKMKSSQPVITDEQRDNATEVDLPGNREWHVVVRNKTLATRFRNHILQDFKRSDELGGGEVPRSHEAAADIFVDVPLEEAPVLERRPPGSVIRPRNFTGTIKVKPLLTPDSEGGIYSKAVLELIRSARRSLLFQIPYISMPSNPRADRGFIDELLKALTQKLKTLDDARVLLRSGGSKFSSPTHAAWYFKSKGVDIANRLAQIENHHTKGMIVDGERVLIGSHNWSKPGVSLNRDASLIFHNPDIAAYYAEAFQVDWDRANPIKPKRFVKPEGVILEAVGAAPPRGYERVRLSDLLKDDD